MNKKTLTKFLFLLYGGLMLWLLFHRSRPDTTAPDFYYWDWVQKNINLRPLHTIGLFWNVLANPQSYIDRMGLAWYEANRQHAIVNLYGNVLMFLPLGFFPPRLSRNLQSIRKTLLFAAGVILAVELLQVLTLRGNCDVDDLLLNLTGTALGYGIFRFSSPARPAEKP